MTKSLIRILWLNVAKWTRPVVPFNLPFFVGRAEVFGLVPLRIMPKHYKKFSCFRWIFLRKICSSQTYYVTEKQFLGNSRCQFLQESTFSYVHYRGNFLGNICVRDACFFMFVTEEIFLGNDLLQRHAFSQGNFWPFDMEGGKIKWHSSRKRFVLSKKRHRITGKQES
jgi:hypothetical protein